VPEHRIRAATAHDLDALGSIYRRASLANDDDRDALLAHPEVLVFQPLADFEQRTRVAEADGRVVGFVTTRDAAGCVELEDLFVDPDWMRRGVGRALVADVIQSLPVASPPLEVTANPHALAFYRSVGFVDGDPVETQLGTGIRMRRTTTS
jgi:GNAT superfamily N-acetyltransferase